MTDVLDDVRQMIGDLESEGLLGYAKTARDAVAEIERLRAQNMGEDVGSERTRLDNLERWQTYTW